MIRLLLYFYLGLLTAALGYTLYALFQPPVYDGAWLLAVFFTLAAVVLAVSSFWLANAGQPEPSTDKEIA